MRGIRVVVIADDVEIGEEELRDLSIFELDAACLLCHRLLGKLQAIINDTDGEFYP